MNIKEYLDRGLFCFQLVINLKNDLNYASFAAVDIYRLILNKLSEHSDTEIILVLPKILGALPEDTEYVDEHKKFIIYITSQSEDLKEIETIINNVLISNKHIEKIEIENYTQHIIDERRDSIHNPPALLEQGQPNNIQLKTNTIRIDLDLIENLGNLVGELLTSKLQMDSYIMALFEGNTKRNPNFVKLKETNKHLGDITDRLRDLSLGVRMIPIATLFRKFPRMVRDIAKKENKEVNLVLEGQETKLDKTLIDEINDPLIHLIRNAVDHGIEEAEDRKSSGKGLTATVHLRAYNEGNSVVIEVEDDGKGIDVEKVKQKAINENIITEDKAKLIHNKELFPLIFQSGFSTAKQVSDISGRGVGLDVVKNKIENLNGVIAVESEKDKGSKFQLKLPLTLSIIQVLLVKDKSEYYAIPFYSIVDIINLEKKEIKDIGEAILIEKEGETLPVFKLSQLYLQDGEQKERTADSEAESPEQENQNQARYMIELAVSLGKFGVAVSEVIGQREIVIKSIGDYLGNIKGISGAAIMKDGQIVLVVDVKTLSEMIKENIQKVKDENLKLNDSIFI